MKRAGYYLAIFAAVIVAYWPVTQNEFVNWDDQSTLYQNRDMTPPSWAGVERYWAHPAGELYIPITYTAWGAVAGLAYGDGKLAASPFHWASVLCHALSAMAVFQILRLMVQDDWACVVGALLFALHPVQVEAVAWASGFKDVLCGLLWLTALWQYMVFARSGGWIHYATATTAFAMAMLAKPTAVAAPIMAGCLAICWTSQSSRQWRKILLELLPWVAISVPIMILTVHVQPAATAPHVAVADRLRVAGDALAFYLMKLAVPVHFAVDYGRAPDWVVSHGWTWLTCLVPLVVAAVIWRWRRVPGLPMAGAAMVVPLLPVLGFMPFSYQYYSTVGDHYLYVAMLGPGLLAAYAVNRWHGRIVPGALLIACGVLSFRQSTHWQDTRTLFEHNLQVNPASLAAHRNLAYLDMSEGKPADAVNQYQLALVTRPDDATTHFNLGNYFLHHGDPTAAIEHYRIAARGLADSASVHFNLGQALRAVGREAEAEEEFAEAFRLSPGLMPEPGTGAP